MPPFNEPPPPSPFCPPGKHTLLGEPSNSSHNAKTFVGSERCGPWSCARYAPPPPSHPHAKPKATPWRPCRGAPLAPARLRPAPMQPFSYPLPRVPPPLQGCGPGVLLRWGGGGGGGRCVRHPHQNTDAAPRGPSGRRPSGRCAAEDGLRRRHGAIEDPEEAREGTVPLVRESGTLCPSAPKRCLSPRPTRSISHDREAGGCSPCGRLAVGPGPGLCLRKGGGGGIGAIPERLQSGHGGKAVTGGWKCGWGWCWCMGTPSGGRVRAAVLERRGGVDHLSKRFPGQVPCRFVRRRGSGTPVTATPPPPRTATGTWPIPPEDGWCRPRTAGGSAQPRAGGDRRRRALRSSAAVGCHRLLLMLQG